MPGATDYGHVYPEAFMVMRYQCKECRHVETIWNSRDGVTPFGVDCIACGADATHVDWSADTYKPYYPPPIGSRVFVNVEPESLLVKATEYVDRWWDSNEIGPSGMPLKMKDHPLFAEKGREGSIEYLASEWYGDGRGPMLVMVTDEAQQERLRGEAQT